MQTSVSKTKNIETYTYLINYPTTKDALKKLDGLANHLKRHKNGIISCISQAEKNYLIYQKLSDMGYADEQIPGWFLRPQYEEEPQPQTTKDTFTLPNHSGQTQPLKSQTTQTPQPRNFMGMQAYDWDEIERYLDINQPRQFTVADRINEDMILEYEEEQWQTYQKQKEIRRRENEKRFNKKIEQKLTETYNPRTALQILLKDPNWRKWYNRLTAQEQNRMFDHICTFYRFKVENKLYQENLQQWNQYYSAMFWQGRFLGKW